MDRWFKCLCHKYCYDYIKARIKLNIKDTFTNFTYLGNHGYAIPAMSVFCSKKCYTKYNKD